MYPDKGNEQVWQIKSPQRVQMAAAGVPMCLLQLASGGGVPRGGPTWGVNWPGANGGGVAPVDGLGGGICVCPGKWVCSGESEYPSRCRIRNDNWHTESRPLIHHCSHATASSLRISRLSSSPGRNGRYRGITPHPKSKRGNFGSLFFMTSDNGGLGSDQVLVAQ